MGSIGQVFTPLVWGQFAAIQADLVSRWLQGSSILDPTMGTGALLSALVETALKQGYALGDLPFERLWGVEIDADLRAEALRTFQSSYSIDMECQFRLGDLFEVELKADLVLGNPPWMQFCDLPDGKEVFKRRFVDSGLVPDRRKMLLGNSRVDVAALVVQRVMREHLNPGGVAWFFVPLSLLLGDGAHQSFRSYRSGEVSFRLEAVWDFGSYRVFPGVSTRYGFVGFRRDQSARFPVPYHVLQAKGWEAHHAQPRFRPDDPLSLLSTEPCGPAPVLSLPKRSVPRQGINTGGENELFFFRQHEVVDQEVCVVDGLFPLPRNRVHPLLTSRQFSEADAPAERWVLLPYTANGRPLGAQDLETQPSLAVYLERNRSRLESRKGALLASWRRRGFWWALLGVGPYCFAPYKVVWEAYGKRRFSPRIFSGTWQVNQALQAYIPCWSWAEAQRVLAGLQHPSVEDYLVSLRMQGTMNWAQPGKVRRFLNFEDS